MKRLLLSLLSLSLLAGNLFAMNRFDSEMKGFDSNSLNSDEDYAPRRRKPCGEDYAPRRQKPIVKTASEETKNFLRQVFHDYGLNPSNYTVLSFNNPNSPAAAIANSFKKIILINDACKGKFDPLNPNDWFKIYCCYHEVGHLKDVWHLTLLSAYMQTMKSFHLKWGFMKTNDTASVLLAHATINYFKQILIPAAEITADSSACEQLLKKDWGLGPIVTALTSLAQLVLDKPSYNLNFHNPAEEYKNMVKILNEHGYIVECDTQNSKVKITIKKNGTVLTQTPEIESSSQFLH